MNSRQVKLTCKTLPKRIKSVSKTQMKTRPSRRRKTRRTRKIKRRRRATRRRSCQRERKPMNLKKRLSLTTMRKSATSLGESVSIKL